MSKPITVGPCAAQWPQRAKWEGTERDEQTGVEGAGMREGYGRVGFGEVGGRGVVAGVCLD